MCLLNVTYLEGSQLVRNSVTAMDIAAIFASRAVKQSQSCKTLLVRVLKTHKFCVTKAEFSTVAFES